MTPLWRIIIVGGVKMGRVFFYVGKYKILLVLIIAIMLVLFILINKPSSNENEIIEIEEHEEIIIPSTIKVDVKGMVENSGVVEINSDSRVIDAINATGGLKQGSNTEYLNLSKKLKDGDVIIVYSDEYIKSLKKEKVVYIELPCECPDKINDGCITNEIVNEQINSEKDELVSINTATKEELTTLPGVGESKAEAIIKYRNENNGFTSLEDIMNVSGIGESAYSKIKDYIKL